VPYLKLRFEENLKVIVLKNKIISTSFEASVIHISKQILGFRKFSFKSNLACESVVIKLKIFLVMADGGIYFGMLVDANGSYSQYVVSFCRMHFK
jgi:hypothetical protein